jgi:dTDP-4-amino-4,6-dideoxygalactose transaminase
MIPLFSASAANAGLDLASAVRRVIDSHWYVLGQEVTAFEQEFAAYVGTSECVSVANGTDALELGLLALGVSRGDRVACVANAGFYGSTALHAIGAQPIYVDIDPASSNMCAASFEEVLAGRPKAVIVTHLYGRMADIETLGRMAREAGVAVVEDCAQSHGARRNGRVSGSLGDIGCFSFYPTKNLGALGDGGAVTCRDAELAGRLKTLRQYGWSTKYAVSTPHGRNSRLDEMQAAVLRAKLPLLDGWNTERRRIAARYHEGLSKLPLDLPGPIGEDFVAHLYVLRLRETGQRQPLRAHLQAHGVATDVHYPIPDHRQTAYPAPAAGPSLDATERACERVLTLPCFPGMSDEQVGQVIEAVRSFFHR